MDIARANHLRKECRFEAAEELARRIIADGDERAKAEAMCILALALCLMNLGLACAEEEDDENALEFYRGALEFLPAGSKPLAEASIRSGAGQVLYRLNRAEEAASELEVAVQLFENAGHLSGCAEA